VRRKEIDMTKKKKKKEGTNNVDLLTPSMRSSNITSRVAERNERILIGKAMNKLMATGATMAGKHRVARAIRSGVEAHAIKVARGEKMPGFAATVREGFAAQKSRKSSKKKKQSLPVSKEWVSPHRAAKEEYIGQYEYDKRQRKQKKLYSHYGNAPHSTERY
jgi:hypothetical protein